MKILLTSHYFHEYRGTQLYNITLAKELKKMGHDVYYFTFEKGNASQKMDEYAKYGEDEKVDLMIASHISCYREKMHLANSRIFISHGIISSLDVPPIDCPSIAVSEEVQRLYGCTCVIRNAIDLERFKPQKRGDKIIYLATEPTKDMIRILEQIGGYELVGSGADVWDIPDVISKASFIISAARGVLEAMACKIPAIVYKSTGFDGYAGEFEELKKNNFSGRRYKKTLTKESLLYEMSKVTEQETDNCYKYVLENNDSKKVAERILKCL